MNAILFRDALLSMLIGVLFITVALLASVTKKGEDAEVGVKPPGNIMVSITWPNGDTDMDLWLDGPGESSPVRYDRKGGDVWDLLRDDRGVDYGVMNFENAYTRGLVEGEYTINVVCFRGCSPATPIVVDVEVGLNTPSGDGGTMPILTTKVTLDREKQEKTVANFRLTDKGDIVRESVNNVFHPLKGTGGK